MKDAVKNKKSEGIFSGNDKKPDNEKEQNDNAKNSSTKAPSPNDIEGIETTNTSGGSSTNKGGISKPTIPKPTSANVKVQMKLIKIRHNKILQ